MPYNLSDHYNLAQEFNILYNQLLLQGREAAVTFQSISGRSVPQGGTLEVACSVVNQQPRELVGLGFTLTDRNSEEAKDVKLYVGCIYADPVGFLPVRSGLLKEYFGLGTDGCSQMTHGARSSIKVTGNAQKAVDRTKGRCFYEEAGLLVESPQFNLFNITGT